MPSTTHLDEELRKQNREAEEKDAERRAKKLNLPYLDLITSRAPIDLKALALIPEKDAKNALFAPLQIVRKNLKVASVNPEDPSAKNLLESLKINYSVDLFVVSETSIKHALSYYEYISEKKEISGKVEIDEAHLRETKNKIKTLEDLKNLIENFKDPYTSQVLEIVLAGAIALRASDIHLEPSKDTNIFRLRIDGLLHTVYEHFSPLVFKSLETRIKLLSRLKLNVTNEAQDGRFTIDLEKNDIEIRTSVIPSEFGESLVLRLLDPESIRVNLSELGLREDDLEIIREEIEKPDGLILTTGPTGSGKTTTLYAFLRHVAKPEVKIITIEDPIEYHIENISQTQINEDSDYSFASGLRSILRQDPDVILIGEIRDKETAEVALNASLTGHLVLSTLHTNDSIGAIPRLIDLEVKPNVIGPALSLVIAQRLVRKLCGACKKELPLDTEIKEKINRVLQSLPERVNKNQYKNPTLYTKTGCSECGNIGYKGRTSVFELFIVTEEIEALIYKNPTEIEIKKETKKDLVTLECDSLLKVFSGVTTLEEIERVLGRVNWDKY